MCFFFNDTATTRIYPLSLHDSLPISEQRRAALGLRALGRHHQPGARRQAGRGARGERLPEPGARSEEHTSELQSRQYLVCRLLLEKKKQYYTNLIISVYFFCTQITHA